MLKSREMQQNQHTKNQTAAPRKELTSKKTKSGKMQTRKYQTKWTLTVRILVLLP